MRKTTEYILEVLDGDEEAAHELLRAMARAGLVGGRITYSRAVGSVLSKRFRWLLWVRFYRGRLRHLYAFGDPSSPEYWALRDGALYYGARPRSIPLGCGKNTGDARIAEIGYLGLNRAPRVCRDCFAILARTWAYHFRDDVLGLLDVEAVNGTNIQHESGGGDGP